MARLVADCAENAAHGADFHWGQGWGRRWSAGELFGLGRGSSTARHSLRENCDLANRKSQIEAEQMFDVHKRNRPPKDQGAGPNQMSAGETSYPILPAVYEGVSWS